MWSTFGKKNKQNKKYWISLVVDIRSSSIGAAIVKNFKGRNKIPVVLETYREQIFYVDKPQSTEFISRSYSTLNRVLEEILIKNPESVPFRNCYVFYGSPWYKNEIKEIKAQEKKQQVLTEALLKKIIKQSFRDTDTKELLEQKYMSISLNGYKTNDPINKKFKEIEINFYESIVHEQTFNEINQIIKQKIQTEDIKHHTHALAAWSVISEKFEPIDNYTILDISGEITELTVVKNDQITQIVSIPHGSHFFVRGLAKKCNMDFLNSFSKLDLILNEEVDEQCEKNSIRAFAEMKQEWADSIRETLKNAGVKSLPSNVFVWVDNEVIKLTRNILKDPEVYLGALKFKRKPNLYFINSEEVENLCVYRNEVKKDSILSLEANFVEMYE